MTKPRAFLELTETTEVATAWYVQLEESDLLAVVYRDRGDAPWTMLLRSRTYASDRAFDSGDRKTGYHVSPLPGETVAQLVAKGHALCTDLATELDGKLWRLDINGGGEQLIAALQQTPFMHIKVEER